MIDKEYLNIISLAGTDYISGDKLVEWEHDWSFYGSGNNDFFEPSRFCNSQLEYYMQLLLF